MDNPPETTQWSQPPDLSLGLSNRIGCLNERVGSELWRNIHRRPLDQRRESQSHKFLGASSSLPCPEDVCAKSQIKQGTFTFGQCHSNLIHQKDGGTHSSLLSDLAVEMWKWCLQKGVIIHAEHLPGTENIRADWESRHVRDSSDWKLQSEVFLQLERRCGPFTIDLFASRTNAQTNAQIQDYCSWRPDPQALAVDALSISWRNHRPYMFPPFSLITRCLEKIDQEEVDTILIAPVWQSQVWFPRVLESLMDDPILLLETHNIVTDIDNNTHPLASQGHLPLAAWPISGRHSAQEAYWRELLQSSTNHGEVQQNLHTAQHGTSGLIGVVNGAYIPFQLL